MQQTLSKQIRLLGSALVCSVFLLAACGGGTDAFVGGTDTGTGDGTGDGDDGTMTDSMNVRIGSGFGANFQEGVIAVQSAGDLSANGSVGLQVVFLDGMNELVTDAISVNFVSDCSALGLSVIDSPVMSVNGVADTTYTAQGCEGSDSIVATAIVNSQQLTAQATINVLSATVGSIEFVSASPDVIGLSGSGLPSVSAVSFRVLDTTGTPAANKDVSFSLTTTVGGLVVDPLQQTTNASGVVTTQVRPGRVSTPVRVIASVFSEGQQLTTQSSQLVVTTGFPDQDSASLAAEKLNPEAFDIIGVRVPITIRLADRFNNPVADGTAVSFTTEGGAIQASCQTSDGGCSVDWISQQPKPADGRVTIQAVAGGEETFRDVIDGDGIFSDGEPFGDLGEAFLDRNEDGIRDSNEEFRDFNFNGEYDGDPDGLYNGSACDESTSSQCANASVGVDVRASLVLVMSGSGLNITINPDPVDAPDSVAITVGDARNQPPPVGTTIAVEVTNGMIEGPSSFTVPNTNQNGPVTYFVVVAGDGNDDTTGSFFVTATTPSGVVTTRSTTITDAPGMN